MLYSPLFFESIEINSFLMYFQIPNLCLHLTLFTVTPLISKCLSLFSNAYISLLKLLVRVEPLSQVAPQTVSGKALLCVGGWDRNLGKVRIAQATL